VNVGGTGSSHGWDFPEGSTVTSATGHQTITADATTHTLQLSSNGAAPSPICTIATGCGAGGSGTVTSVGLSVPSWLTVGGSPVTTSGTLAVTATTGQTANLFLATPNGSTGAVGLRAIVAADIPTLNQSTTGTAANLSGTPALPNGTTGTTQTAGDATTKLATDAFVSTAIGNIVVPWSCQPGTGDGLNAITAGTYPITSCYNDTGKTITITGIKCYADAGTPTLSVTNGTGTALLTGAITCSTSFAAGTQSGTVNIAAGDYLKFSVVASGTAKQVTAVVTGTHP
jgi:hypothetical protein